MKGRAMRPTNLTETELARPGEVIGYRRDGRPIFLLAGAADDDTGSGDDAGDGGRDDDTGDDRDDEGGDDDTGNGDDDAGDDELGDAGRRALERERTARKRERDARRQLERRVAELESSSKPQDEQQLDQARREARDEALSEANRRLVAATARGLAAGKLADADDLARFVDLSDVDVDDDGNVDERDLTGRLDELLKARPYLAPEAKGRRTGSSDGGARGRSSAPEPTPGVGRLRHAYAESGARRRNRNR